MPRVNMGCVPAASPEFSVQDSYLGLSKQQLVHNNEPTHCCLSAPGILWAFVTDTHSPREGFQSFPFSFPCPKYQTTALVPGQQHQGEHRGVGTVWVTRGS